MTEPLHLDILGLVFFTEHAVRTAKSLDCHVGFASAALRSQLKPCCNDGGFGLQPGRVRLRTSKLGMVRKRTLQDYSFYRFISR